MITSSNDYMDINQIKNIIHQINMATSSFPRYTLYFSRELKEYEKDLIEKEGLDYTILPPNIIGELSFDIDTIYVVPNNFYKPIKLVIQRDDENDIRNFTV